MPKTTIKSTNNQIHYHKCILCTSFVECICNKPLNKYSKKTHTSCRIYNKAKKSNDPFLR